MKMKYDTTNTAGKIAVMREFEETKRKPICLVVGTNEWSPPIQPTWNWRDYDYNYPAEPEVELVPWTFKTCPHLATAAFRYKSLPEAGRYDPSTKAYYFPSSVHDSGIELSRVLTSWDHLLSRLEVSFDNGRTWLPCGTEEKR